MLRGLTFFQNTGLKGLCSDLTVDLPKNCTTLVSVLLWTALVLGSRVPCPSDTLNMSKPNIHTHLWVSHRKALQG